MAYMHKHGSQTMRAWVQRNQRRLDEFLEDAQSWEHAPEAVTDERKTDWDIFCAAADAQCPSSPTCAYGEAARKFFQANESSFSQTRLAVAIRGIIINGPSKDWRVPFLAGSSNTGKSTIVESVEDVFGEDAVMQLPAESDNKGGALRDMDEFYPVVFIEKWVIHRTQSLKLFNGQRSTCR